MQTSKYTKYIIIVMVILFVIISAISCSTHTHTYTPAPSGKKIPPGQVKKMNGDKSAKAYAPGQKKKH